MTFDNRGATNRHEVLQSLRKAIDAITEIQSKICPPTELNALDGADNYYPPSLERAAQELDMLLTHQSTRPPHPDHAATDTEWLMEVAAELDWIRDHPPNWSTPLTCYRCGLAEPRPKGPPRDDGRPREGQIKVIFRPGIGVTTAHTDPCPTR